MESTFAERYTAACDAAEERFAPLTDTLRAVGCRPVVEQTGGMVFCAVVYVGYESRYMFGPEGEWMVGYYSDDDDLDGTLLEAARMGGLTPDTVAFLVNTFVMDAQKRGLVFTSGV